jgi:hypothetical protein
MSENKKPRFREAAGISASTALPHHDKTIAHFLKTDQAPNPLDAQITSYLDNHRRKPR